MSKAFAMPKAVKIMGRSSSITNSFVNGIIPVIHPSDDEVRHNLEILGMNEDTVCCAYCGDACTEWDHFHPLIVDRKPTGYVSEINNLVPACSKCNQSKGNSEWETWMRSDAEKSPKTRGIVDIESRIEKLKEYDRLAKKNIDIESIVGTDEWEKHWKNCDLIIAQMREAQLYSDMLKKKISDSLGMNASVTSMSTTARSSRAAANPAINDFVDWMVLNGVGKSTAANYKSALNRILEDAQMTFDDFMDRVDDEAPKYWKGGEKSTLGDVYSNAGRAVVSQLLDYVHVE